MKEVFVVIGIMVIAWLGVSASTWIGRQLFDAQMNQKDEEIRIQNEEIDRMAAERLKQQQQDQQNQAEESQNQN